MQGLSYANSLASSAPSVLDRIDYDRALEEWLNTLGVAPALLRAQDEVQALRAARQAAQAEESLSESRE